MKKMYEINSYPMSELVPLITDFINEDKEVVFTARGNSMRPLLRDGKDQLILASTKEKNIGKGDVVLYKRENGTYVAHRILDVAPDGSFTMLGDAQFDIEKGIRPDQIIAVASGFIIRGKEKSVNSKCYRKYVKFWKKSKHIKKLYLKFFYKWLSIKEKIKKQRD